MKKLVYGTVGLGLALSAAACSPGGGSDDAGDGEGPIRIAYVGLLSGANYVKGVENAFEMAIEEINEAGGIDGRKVEYKEYDSDITPEGSARATSLAMRDEPDAFVGFNFSAGLKASIPSIKAANIPVIHNSLPALTSAKDLGYDGVYRMSPTTTQYATAGNKYLVDTFGITSAMVIHTEDAAPTAGGEKIVEELKAEGIASKIRAIAPSATDLTEPILAAKGVDAIWSWGYAGTEALTIKQAAQNGIDVPVMTFSAGSIILNKLIPDNLATDNVLSVSNCGAPAQTSETAKKFVENYKAKYGVEPHDGLEPRNYDAVYLLKAAIEKAGTTDGVEVAKALGEVEIDGVCGTFKSDDKHNLYQNVPVLKWGGGKPALAGTAAQVESDF